MGGRAALFISTKFEQYPAKQTTLNRAFMQRKLVILFITFHTNTKRFFEDFHFWRWRSPCGVVGDLCCQDLNQTSRQKQAPGVLLCEHPHNNRSFAKPRPQNPSDWGEHQRSGEYKITNIDYKYIYKWVVTRKIFWWHRTLNWMHELCPKSIFFSWAVKISESSWLGNFPRYSFEFFTRGQCLNPEQRDKRPGSMWIDLRSRSTQYENFIDHLF